MSELELRIMEYAKQTDFHGTLRKFLEQNPDVEEGAAVEALRSLKRQRIASTSPDLMDSWIGATNFGYKKLGWR